MTRMTRMGRGFAMIESLFRGHPPGEHPSDPNPLFIRVIREIRGSNCCFWVNRSEASTTTTSPFVEAQNRRPSTQTGELK